MEARLVRQEPGMTVKAATELMHAARGGFQSWELVLDQIRSELDRDITVEDALKLQIDSPRGNENNAQPCCWGWGMLLASAVKGGDKQVMEAVVKAIKVSLRVPGRGDARILMAPHKSARQRGNVELAGNMFQKYYMKHSRRLASAWRRYWLCERQTRRQTTIITNVRETVSGAIRQWQDLTNIRYCQQPANECSFRDSQSTSTPACKVHLKPAHSVKARWRYDFSFSPH